MLYIDRYREAGAEVIDVLSSFSQSVERASIDEAYVDLTEEVNKRLSQYIDLPSEELKNTFIIGWEEKKPNDDETDTGNYYQFNNHALVRPSVFFKY